MNPGIVSLSSQLRYIGLKALTFALNALQWWQKISWIIINVNIVFPQLEKISGRVSFRYHWHLWLQVKETRWEDQWIKVIIWNVDKIKAEVGKRKVKRQNWMKTGNDKRDWNVLQKEKGSTRERERWRVWRKRDKNRLRGEEGESMWKEEESLEEDRTRR